MRHALMYQGSFEKNFANLSAGASTFRDHEDQERPSGAWPAGIDGLRLGYMEKSGRNFFVVRVQHENDDIVLREPVLIDPPRHLGYGPRLGPEPTVIHDEPALELFDAIMAANASQRAELQQIRNRLPARPHRQFK